MLNEIALGLSALKTAQELVKGLDIAKDQAALTELRLGLQAQILEAQQALFAAQEEKAALLKAKSDAEAEVVRLMDWSAERENYALKRFHPGTVAYAYQPGEAKTQPPHNLCASCYDNRKKGLLQPTAQLERGYKMHRCGSCGGSVPIGGEMSE